MLKEAMQFLIEKSAPQVLQIENKHFTDRSLKEVRPDRLLPGSLKFDDLDGFILYVNNNDAAFGEKAKDVFVIAESWNRAVAYRRWDGAGNNRVVIAEIEFPVLRSMDGDWYSQDQFIIEAMTGFVPEGDLHRLLQLVSVTSNESVTNLADDGVSQQVQVKAGIKLKAEQKIENPFRLRAVCTFPQLKQPERQYILRAKTSGRDVAFALFGAGGDHWKANAARSLREYLAKHIIEFAVY